MACRNTVDIRIVLLLMMLTLQCLSLSFESGRTYQYAYETIIHLNELNPPGTIAKKDVGFILTAELDITPMYQAGDTQLIKLQISSASVSSVSRSGLEKKLMVLLKYPVYFELNTGSGTIGMIHTVDKEKTFCSNVKKGIVSLFQLQEQEGKREEIDVSGVCDVGYTTGDRSVTKTKHRCKNLEIAGQFTHPNQMFGVTVSSTSTFKYEVGDGIIGNVFGTDRHVVVLNAKQGINAFVTATQKMTFKSSSKTVAVITSDSIEDAVKQLYKGQKYRYSPSLLGSVSESTTCFENCEKPLDLLVKLKDDFVSSKLSKIESGRAYLKLLRSFRGIGKISIEEVLTSPESYYIVPQLIDVAAATQTPASHKALMDLIQFDGVDNVEYPERFLFASAYSSHPPEAVLQDVLSKMKEKVLNENLQQSLALGLGALVYTYCKVDGQCKDKVVDDYKVTVKSRLKSCEDENCRLMYIESIGNSGLVDFLPDLLEIAEKSESAMLAFMAVKALRRMPQESFNQEVKMTLNRIFHQTQRDVDSSVRAAVLEIILKLNPSTAEIRNILLNVMLDQRNHEASTFILKKFFDITDKDESLRTLVDSMMKDTYINNYKLMSQNGKSSAFSSYLAVTKDGNSTYGLYMETTKSGVMKRSAMEVQLVNKMTTQPLLTFGIYAQGLAALIGEGTEAEAEEEPTAGLALTLMDVLLRPVEFFRGSGGLMSAVWSAPSDPVSALQGNLLLQDHSQKFHLSNGLIVDLEVLGVASIDLSGSISISLWYKNSHSVITNSGAIVVEGTLKIESKVLKAGISLAAETESAIDFVTDVDFDALPFKMCLQMNRPTVHFSHRVKKYEKMKKIKTYKYSGNRKSSSNGVSYLINEKNSIMCSSMPLE